MWKAIEYTPEYLPQILDMTKEQYGEDNDISNVDFLQHEYFENPAGDALISLALDEQKRTVAGQYMIWPMWFQCGNLKVRSANSLNTLTEKRYRGQGIFTGLAEYTYQRAAEQKIGFCYGMPNPNSYPGFLKKLCFHELGSLPLYLRPLKPSAMVREFLKSHVLSVPAQLFDGCFAPKQEENHTDVQIVPITVENAGKMDIFWERVQNKYPILNIRDSSYLKFRYLDMPRRTYLPFLAVKNGEPVAWAVGRIMEVAGMQCGMLADFLFAEHEETAAKKLLAEVLCEFQKLGASLAGCLMLEHTEEVKILKKKGFFRCPKPMEPQPFPLVVRAFDPAYEKTGLFELQNWFFTMGDYDVI